MKTKKSVKSVRSKGGVKGMRPKAAKGKKSY
jgi:hypothetical protein